MGSKMRMFNKTMPYKCATIKLPKEKDRRRKLTDTDKENIKTMYRFENLPIREIARRFAMKCCRRTIQFVLFPDRAKKVNFSGHWKLYYDKNKHRESIKNHRRYKHKTLCTEK